MVWLRPYGLPCADPHDSPLTKDTEGVYGGVLISADFRKHFPEVEDANVSGITASCFSVGLPAPFRRCSSF